MCIDLLRSGINDFDNTINYILVKYVIYTYTCKSINSGTRMFSLIIILNKKFQ
jgi:hypothetical protein